jgi:hypothetical protein
LNGGTFHFLKLTRWDSSSYYQTSGGLVPVADDWYKVHFRTFNATNVFYLEIISHPFFFCFFFFKRTKLCDDDGKCCTVVDNPFLSFKVPSFSLYGGDGGIFFG